MAISWYGNQAECEACNYGALAVIYPLLEQWAKETGADILWGIPVEKMNDDRFGRALDAFFPHRHSILAYLALHVSRDYELAEAKHTLVDAESREEVPCRVIFVFSTADQKVVRQQRKKQIDKIREGLEYIQRSVAAGNRSTDAVSVARRVEKLFGSKRVARYFAWEMAPLSKQEQSALPRPKRGCKMPSHRFVFRFDCC